MLYMFYSDTAFSDVNAALGKYDNQIRNYFYNAAEIVDSRSSYLLSNERMTCVPFGVQAYGSASLIYDDLQTIPTGVKGPTLTDNDKAALAVLTASENDALKKRFFNIVEYAFLQHTTAGGILDTDTMDVNLQGSSSFNGYVAGSVALSAGSTSSSIRLTGNTTSSTMTFSDYIEFKFAVSTSYTLQVRVWLAKAAFRSEYPQTVMTKCIYPCDPMDLLSMSYSNVSEAISGASSWTGSTASPEIINDDHTGTAIFTTKYVNRTSLANYSMPFTIFYKGGIPSLNQMREYIKYSLSTDYPSVTEAEWAAILPDLFVEASYYIIPYYTMRELISTASTYVDRGYAKYMVMINKIRALFPNKDFTILDQKACLIHIAGSGLEFYVFPGDDNDTTHQDFSVELPSYIAVDAQNEAFAYMTTNAQQFAVNSANVIKLAQGDDTLSSATEYTKVCIDGKYYYMFVVNSVEYYVLARESY